jgi:hypothetical protein
VKTIRELLLTLKGERLVATTFAALLLTLKVIYAFRMEIDSDETQHLHVIWGWMNGLIPYRDFFDNHSPLFHLCYLPLFAAIGEKSDIIIPMRFGMLPLYVLCCLCVYRLGERLFSRWVGIWSAILAGAWPTFFIKTSEFRTDDLWAVLWLVAALFLLDQPFTRMRAFLFGLTLGAAFATSMKTSLLALALALAGLIIVAREIASRTFEYRHWLSRVAPILFGLALFPVAIVAFFAARGAFAELYYCTIKHNVLLNAYNWETRRRQIPSIILLLVLVSICGCVSVRSAAYNCRNRVALVALVAGIYLLLLKCFWPLVPTQDYLPILPLLFLVVVPAGFSAWRWLRHFRYLASPLVPLCLACAAEIIYLVSFHSPLVNCTAGKIDLIRDVLALTDRNDFVMDAKGEVIFRRRPYYYVLESLTLKRIELGLLPDNIPEQLVKTRTRLITRDGMPPRATQFIDREYLPISRRLRAVGKLLNAADNRFPNVYSFDVVVPARYALLPETGGFTGTVDGTLVEGPRFLEPGHHEARSFSNTGTLALIWSNAIEKGFSPFSESARAEAEN